MKLDALLKMPKAMKRTPNAGNSTLDMANGPTDGVDEVILIAITIQRQPNTAMAMPLAVDEPLVGT